MEYLVTIPLLYLIINVIYYFTFAIASKFPSRVADYTKSDKMNKIAVLIPAYKEDAVIVQTAYHASNHDYPRDKYDVYVIADRLQASTIMKLGRIAVGVVEVSFEQSSKTKAINATLERIEVYDIAVVLDADNVMAPRYLTEINSAFNSGARAIQGQRTAKNEENNLARLDAISEGINNNIFRKGHQNLGLSSALIGSGMAFDFRLFRSHMAKIKALGGFDKELELRLLKDNITIFYVPTALVYDEKVSDKQSFTNQRTRWIAAQIRFGMKSFGSGLAELFVYGNVDHFNKVLQFVLLPRLILLGSLFILTLVSLMISQSLLIISLTALVICGLTLVLATPSQYFGLHIFQLLTSLPAVFLRMILAIGGYKKAATNFLHTAHKNNLPT